MAPADGGVLGLDRDALFTFEVEGVHHAVGLTLVPSHGSTLAQEGIHERCLAMVHVGDYRYVADPVHRSGLKLFIVFLRAGIQSVLIW